MVRFYTPNLDEACDALDLYDIDYDLDDCDAGYSRSPAVAAAIAKAFGVDDEEYFSGGRYCPNRHVYRTTLNEFAERGYFG